MLAPCPEAGQVANTPMMIIFYSNENWYDWLPVNEFRTTRRTKESTRPSPENKFDFSDGDFLHLLPKL